jgi:type I restriction enzyme, S subunit
MIEQTIATVSGWHRRTLSQLGEYHNGLAFKPSDWREEGTKIIRIEELNNPTGQYDYFDGQFPEINRIENGDLVFSWSATLKVVVWKHGEGVLNQHLFKVIPNDDVDKTFLYYLLDYNMESLRGGSHGSTMKHIKRGELQTYVVNLPTEPEQREIARILTTLDNLIEKTEALIAKYQAIKQGMMHDLFTRGVDEHGHLRSTYAEAPELYKESELGWIPKGWDCLALGLVVPKAEYGISVSLDDAEGIPVLRMNNLSHGRVNVTDIKRSCHSEARRLLLHENDVLFNRTNSIEHVGRTSVWRNELPQASFASYLVRLVPDISRLLPDYLVYWMNRPETQLAIRQFATPGVHQVNINPTNLRKSLICLPVLLKEQTRIVRVIAQQENRLGVERLYLNNLVQQKSGLMQDLLTGKVRVKVDEEAEHV